MASWRRKPNGKYQVRWRDPDGRSRAKDVETRKTCLELVKVVGRCEELGERYEPRGVRAEPAVEEVAQSWLRAIGSENEATTVKQHGHRLHLFVRWLRSKHPRGPLRLELLSVQVLKDFHAELDGFEGKARELTTRNKYARTVHQLWAWAGDQDELEPYTPRLKTLKLRAPPAPRTRALPWADIDRVIEQAHGRHRKLLVVLRYTGLRVDQALNLEWPDFDLERGTMYVRPELGKTRAEKVGRLVPISPHLVAELAGWGKREGFVLPVGEKQTREGRGRDLWRFFERAEIDPMYWRRRPHHAFRLAFETNLKAARVDPEAVEFYVGHDLKIRGTYNDPWALPLTRLVKSIPKVGEAPKLKRLVDQAWTETTLDPERPALKAAR